MNMEVEYILNEQINVHMWTYACQIDIGMSNLNLCQMNE
jgi:hypothetical protein